MNLNTLTPYYKVIADAQSRALDATCYVVFGCTPTAAGSGLQVNVAAGDSVEGGTPHNIFTGGSVTCTAASSAASLLYRRDIVYRNSAGTLTVTAGTAALLTSTTPVPPALPASATLLAVIFIAPGQTLLTATDVEDCRQVRVDDQMALNVKAFGAKGDAATDDTAAIQAAIDAAAASGYFGGATVYMPPGNYVIYSAGTECLRVTGTGSITLRGAGVLNTVLTVKSTVGATTDAIRIVGSVNALQGLLLEDFRIAPQSGTPGRHAINVDTTTYAVSQLRLRRLYLSALGGKGISSTNPTLLDGFFQSSIEDCAIYNGISLSRAGDSMSIERNTLAGANTGVDVSFVPGASASVIRANNITTSAGGIHLGNDCTDTRIENNFIESSGTGSNSAALDIDGASGKVATNIVVRGNLIVPIQTLDCIRVNYGDQVFITENTLIRPAPAVFQIKTTANAKNTHIGHNAISPTTDTFLSQGLSDSGANTSYDFIDYGTKTELHGGGLLIKTADVFGYGTGAGGAITQQTSSSTSVILNKPTGQITTVALTTAVGAEERFTVSNTSVAATDTISLGTTYNGAGTPAVSVLNVAANAFDIVITNLHAANALNAVCVINFAVIKAVAS